MVSIYLLLSKNFPLTCHYKPKNNAQPKSTELYFIQQIYLGLQAWQIAFHINTEKTVPKSKRGKPGHRGVFAAPQHSQNKRLLLIKEN